MPKITDHSQVDIPEFLSTARRDRALKIWQQRIRTELGKEKETESACSRRNKNRGKSFPVLSGLFGIDLCAMAMRSFLRHMRKESR